MSLYDRCCLRREFGYPQEVGGDISLEVNTDAVRYAKRLEEEILKLRSRKTGIFKELLDYALQLEELVNELIERSNEK